MTDILKILQQVTNNYSIFEKDQVLTERQLNSVTDYLNNQNRLTRLYSLGVGVICGLRVSQSSQVIEITKGVGITTDGDLLYYANNTVFDRFLEYDKSYPKYPPLYVGGNPDAAMIPVYQLISESATESRKPIYSLSQFLTQTGKKLENMVAVLLMESYINDPDICTGNDCDNLGKDCFNTQKLLLIEKDSMNLFLQPAITTPNNAFNHLNEIIADRPLIPSSINAVEQLAQIYHDVCTAIHTKLLAELPKLYLNCSAFLEDVFSADPTNTWITKLTEIYGSVSLNIGNQYYYSFLKDVVETYNQFLELLFDDNTWCCPDINCFPKHLLLGNLVPGNNVDENRTAFYPSPAVSQTQESLNRAKFIARKLDTLIQTFLIPFVDSASIRITPSFFEDRLLEERAIPFYYQVNETHPIHKNWNYLLTKRGMAERNYSYNATAYGAQGAAANPLTSQIGRFSFFRIEGHLGKNVTTAITTIENEIKSKNLPFTVRSVLLGQDKTKVVKKPGIRYSDLHRFHYLLRQDTYHQLNEVAQFSNTFKQQVDQNVTGESNANSLRRDAEQRNTIVTQKARAVATKLNRNYATYKADISWQPELVETVTAASQFKFNIGDVVKTEFTTPFDTLIGNTRIQWLDWLDEIINKKDEAEDEKLLFANFISENPGMEYFSGVVRGGTFILVHDSNNTVVADFMLSYYCDDKIEVVPEEPPLVKPTIRPDFVVNQGIRVLPSIPKQLTTFIEAPEFNQRLVNFTTEPVFTQKLDQQKKYLDIYTSYVTSTTDLFSNINKSKLQGSDVKMTNPELDLQIREVALQREKVEFMKQKFNQSNLTDEDRRTTQQMVNQAEIQLSESLRQTTNYIATSGISVANGSEGFQAMLEVSNSLGVLSQQGEALNNLQTGLATIHDRTHNTGLKMIIGNMLSQGR